MSMAAITGAESLCDNDIYIAVMGATGAGKSTFISKCTEKPVAIGGSLESCKIHSLHPAVRSQLNQTQVRAK